MLLQAMLLALLISSPIHDLVELPAALGKMPRLKPPPAGLSEAIQQGEGVFLPHDLSLYIAKMMIVYSDLQEIGQDAIDATREADRKSCSLRLDAAKVANAKECPTCFWQASKWWFIGGLGGVIVGAAAMAWASH